MIKFNWTLTHIRCTLNAVRIFLADENNYSDKLCFVQLDTYFCTQKNLYGLCIGLVQDVITLDRNIVISVL